MSDNAPLKPIRRKVVINITSSGGSELQNCFFLRSEVEGFYNFYNQDGQTLATGVSDGTPFPFLHDGIAWTIYDLKIHHHLDRDRIQAKGGWTNNVPEPPNADGTFQAESGGGADGDEIDEAAPTCVHPANEIEIRKVAGDPDKDKLKHCYFLPTSVAGEYDFFSKDCNLLQSGLKTKHDFTFTHDKIHWTVTDFEIDDTKATGTWSNPDEFANEQNGSFQAESGGGAGEGEATSAASA